MTTRANKYIFCGCAFEIFSGEEIIPESTFSLFKADFQKADYSIQIIRAQTLPPKRGECVYSSDRRNTYCNDEKTYEYTAYFDSHERAYVDFACKVDEQELYVSFPGPLRELTVFDGLNLPEMLLKKGTGIMHCSFIEYNGSAILFAGDKQVGKSTQAALWEKHCGIKVINGDRAAILCENGKLYACGIPFCGTSGICSDAKMPLKAVVCLSKGKENTLVRMSGIEAYLFLLGKFTYNCKSKASSDAVSAIVSGIAEKIPVFDYSCLKDISAVDCLKNAIDRLTD